MADSGEGIVGSVEDLDNKMKNVLKDFKGTNEEVKALEKNFKKAFAVANKGADEVTRGINDLDSKLEELPGTFAKGMKKGSKEAFKATQKEFFNQFEKEIKGLNHQLEIGNKITMDQKHLVRDLKSANEILGQMSKSMEGIDSRDTGSKFLANMKKSSTFAKQIGQDIKKGNSSNLRGYGKYMSVKGENMQARGKNLSSSRSVDTRMRRLEALKSGGLNRNGLQRGRGFKGSGSRARSSGAMARRGRGMVSKGSRMLSGGKMMGGLAKGLPMIGAIVQGLSMINDAVNAQNRTYTSGMKDYKALAGTQLDASNFAEKGNSFNRTIRNSDRNWKMGMGKDEWKSMFESMSNAGLVLPGVAKNLGKLEDVMVSTRQTSLKLGVSTEVMGETMVNQSLEMGTGLSTMQDGFTSVAQEAKRAGIESNRFLGIVQQSSLAMGAYGNFTKIAATTLGKLSNNAGITQTEAEKMTGDISTYFKGMSAKEALTSQGLQGRGAKDRNRKRLEDEMDSIGEKLAKLKGDTSSEAIQERSALKAKRGSISRAVDTNSEMSISNAQKYITNIMPMLLEKIDAVKGNRSREQYMQEEGQYITGNLGIPEELLETMRRTLGSTKDNINPLTKSLNTVMEKAFAENDVGAQKTIKENLAILNKGTEASKGDVAKANKYFTDLMVSAGVDKGDAADALYAASGDSKSIGGLFTKLFENLEGGGKFSAVSSNAISNEMLKYLADETRALGKENIRGTDGLIKTITPLEKMSEYVKDDAVWKVASSDVAKLSYKVSQQIRDGVSSIYRELTSSDTEAAEHDLRVANEYLDSGGKKLMDGNINLRQVSSALESGKSATTKEANNEAAKSLYKSLYKLIETGETGDPARKAMQEAYLKAKKDDPTKFFENFKNSAVVKSIVRKDEGRGYSNQNGKYAHAYLEGSGSYAELAESALKLDGDDRKMFMQKNLQTFKDLETVLGVKNSVLNGDGTLNKDAAKTVSNQTISVVINQMGAEAGENAMPFKQEQSGGFLSLFGL